MLRRRAAVVVLGGAALLAFEACGGSSGMSKAAYRATLKEIRRELTAAPAYPEYHGLPVANPSKRTMAAAARANAAASLRAAARLERLHAPADARTDNERLVAGLRAVAAQSRFVARIEAGAPILATKAPAGQAAIRAYEGAGVDLARKGYGPKPTGARYFVAISSSSLSPPAPPACANGPHVVPPVYEKEPEAQAVQHLVARGFRVRVERGPVASVPAARVARWLPENGVCLHGAVTLVVSTGRKLLPHPPPAVPFELVSSAGTQPATELHAALCARPRKSCSFSWSKQLAPTAPGPVRLSVVRPGELVRFAFSEPIRPVTIAGERIPMTLDVLKFCGSFVPTAFPALRRNRWQVYLSPGAYRAVLLFVHSSPRGFVGETGVFGLLVSRTKPASLVRAPRC